MDICYEVFKKTSSTAGAVPHKGQASDEDESLTSNVHGHKAELLFSSDFYIDLITYTVIPGDHLIPLLVVPWGHFNSSI